MVDLITWLTRWRERRRLLRLDDQMLTDIGYSPALLRDGVRAWPWRGREDSMVWLGRFRLGGELKTTQPASTRSAPGPAGVDTVIRRAA